jgi:SpoVK/Ycf46/Vps4 family AAA+-type ATPase
MAFTVAKKYQPAIIYIDEVEEIFKAGELKILDFKKFILTF